MQLVPWHVNPNNIIGKQIVVDSDWIEAWDNFCKQNENSSNQLIRLKIQNHLKKDWMVTLAESEGIEAKLHEEAVEEEAYNDLDDGEMTETSLQLQVLQWSQNSKHL